MSIRTASHAGSWYTSNGDKLGKELDSWLTVVPKTTEEGSLSSFPLPVRKCRAIIGPHAGYSYSGPAAAYAYRCIDPEPIERVFILGPSHHAYIDGCVVSSCDEYETPLGNLRLDKTVIGELHATGQFPYMDQGTDEDEHSLEMHLPYIYKVMEGRKAPYTIVPIMVGAISTTKEAQYGRVLAPYLADPKNLFVVSSDFCHWGTRFRYTYKDAGDSDAPIWKRIEALDREGMAIIETIDPADFAAYLKRTRNTICGRHPIGVLLNATAALLKDMGADRTKAELKFVHYAQSSKVTSERDSSVSYASAYLHLDM
ncbi:MEMO1 family [Gaertneriomyces semiglobifer]|nr:MEMO1 family [Gaertneriomyces semiglobifer]